MSEVRKRKTDRDDGSKSKKPVKTKQVQAKSSPVTSIGSVFLDFREIFKKKNQKKFEKLFVLF